MGGGERGGSEANGSAESERTFTLVDRDKGDAGRRTVVVVGSHGVSEVTLPDRGALILGRDPAANMAADLCRGTARAPSFRGGPACP